jgi:hypothetical protein
LNDILINQTMYNVWFLRHFIGQFFIFSISYLIFIFNSYGTKIPESPWGSPIPVGDGDGDAKQFPDGDGDGSEKQGWGW